MSYAKLKALMNKVLGVGYRHNSTTVAADALAIPVTAEYVVKTIGVDAEALTLADGLFEGQPLTIIIDASPLGALATLTPTTKTGFTSLYLRNAGDRVRLRWVNKTVGWVKEEIERAPSEAASVAVAGGTLAIPITAERVHKTTGGVEALTLANGIYDGQRLSIRMVADGGDGTLTPASAVNFTTVVFADVGDEVHLRYNGVIGGWVLEGYHGNAAPPVIS